MRYGFYLATRGPTATREGILALAREGERLGLDSVMITDHIVLPVESHAPPRRQAGLAKPVCRRDPAGDL